LFVILQLVVHISGLVVEQWKSGVKGTSLSVTAMLMLRKVSYKEFEMFTDASYKQYNRSLHYAEHILRARTQQFKPMTEAQYNTLCDKIEAA